MSDAIEARLASSFEDRRLSRAERQALAALVAGLDSPEARDAVRRRAFEIARSALASAGDAAVLDWLEDVVKALRDGASASSQSALAEAHFSPGEGCLNAIERLLRGVRGTADICVFTITDDRLAESVLDAHRRRVAVRVIADNEKAEDLGSDIDRFERAGVAVRVDRSPFHMHHKFLVVDGRTLLTGSYNWTRGAARDNEENLIVTDDPRLVGPFAEQFERLWGRLA